MKKPSAMGSSKYEFDHLQFDKDIAANKDRYFNKKKYITDELLRLLKHDGSRLEETWEMIIESLREMKTKN